jgi:hypothetical protein
MWPYEKDALVRESTLCVAGALIGRLWQIQIYIIDHNPSWKENQRQKKESFWIREFYTLYYSSILHTNL